MKTFWKCQNTGLSGLSAAADKIQKDTSDSHRFLPGQTKSLAPGAWFHQRCLFHLLPLSLPYFIALLPYCLMLYSIALFPLPVPRPPASFS